MSDIDFEHISDLFAIIEGCAQHTGKFGSIQTEAFNELMTINDTLRKKQMDAKAAKDRQEAADKPKVIPSDPEPDVPWRPARRARTQQ